MKGKSYHNGVIISPSTVISLVRDEFDGLRSIYIYISICPEQRPMHHGHGVLTQHGTTHISLDQVGSHIVNLLPLSETSGKLENDARISFDFVSQMY